MRPHTHPTGSLFLSMLLLGACLYEGCDSSGSQPLLHADESLLPMLRFERRTSDPEIVLRNLSSQIDSLTRAVAADPSNLSYGAQLVELELARTQYLGTYSDFDHADELTHMFVTALPDQAQVHVLRASYLSSVHRFTDAEAELRVAETLGDSRALLLLGNYDLARGENLNDVFVQRSEIASRTPSYQTLTSLAAAEAALGRFDDADGHYRDALQSYRDVSPLPVAWVFFQRGVMWGEMADRADRARPLYEEAVRLLPDYVVGNVHLAECEHADGEIALAMARLERIVEQTEDPEPASRLAQYLADTDPARAEQYRQRALAGYEGLLSAYGSAFLDHASEFFANAGADPQRALSLARENLHDRTNARAYIIALQAAEVAGDNVALCDLLGNAAREPRHNVNLDVLVARLQPICRR